MSIIPSDKHLVSLFSAQTSLGDVAAAGLQG